MGAAGSGGGDGWIEIKKASASGSKLPVSAVTGLVVLSAQTPASSPPSPSPAHASG